MRLDTPRCEARPLACRSPFPSDWACGSIADALVEFHGAEVAVCRLHAATYDHWALDAELHAARLWHWETPVPRASPRARPCVS